MLLQNYQKLISSQGVVSSKVLAVPNKQNFRYKYNTKKMYISVSHKHKDISLVRFRSPYHTDALGFHVITVMM
jgi:hypothetical protein